MIDRKTIFLIVEWMVVIVLMLAGIAGAATQINSCTVISSPGEYALDQNILNSSETYCINITSSDVVFEGLGRTIDGMNISDTYGIYIYNPTIALTNITLKNLVVKDWANGLYLKNVRNGRIYNNEVRSNNRGIYLISSGNNTIFNNNFNNTNNSWDDGNNIWNITKTMGQNIVLGAWRGGNYWSNYFGMDTDGDGLGNTSLPYNSSGAIVNGGDYLPLIRPGITSPPAPTPAPTPGITSPPTTPAPTPAPTPSKPVCSAVEVLPGTATFIIEDPKKFYAVTKDENGDPIKETIKWESSNSNAGTIDPVTGVFTALRPGITTIKAICGNVSGTATATVKTTQFYQFDIIGKTGQAGIIRIGDGPSINDMGNVAFSASVGNRNTIFTGNGSLFPDPKQITPLSSRLFSDKVMINNQNHVLASFIAPGSPSASFIALFDPILYDRYMSGSVDYYAINIARGGGSSIQGSYYEAVAASGGSINDADQVAYTALDSYQQWFATGNSPDYGGLEPTKTIALSVRSMMDDDGHIVLRGKGSSLTEPIGLYNYDLSFIVDIANTGMGFTAIGSNPGISNNGRIVSFYGDLSSAGADALKTTPGPGIFASIDEGTGGNRKIVRVAGQQIEKNSASGGNDDGICDAGETCFLADLGFDSAGNPVFFNSYDTSGRVGVIHQDLGESGMNEDSFLVSFIATPNAAIPISSTDQKGLWTTRVDVGQKSGVFVYNTSVPMKVAQIGDVNIGGNTITDIRVHDQIANIGTSLAQHRGDNRVAFWASTNAGNMVVRATKVDCGASTTARRIATLDASGPQYATPNKDITLSINYIGTSNCAKYFFRVFGRYGTGRWELLEGGNEIAEASLYTFPMSIKIPRPSGNENTFTIRVVGQSQRWPDATNYDMMKEIKVNMLYIKEIKIEGSPILNDLTTESDVIYTAVLSDINGAKVNWVSAPTGTRNTQTSTIGRPRIPNREQIGKNPWTDKSPKDTHGKKNVTAKVTWIKGGQTYNDEIQKDFNLSFTKEAQDFGSGDSPCTGYINPDPSKNDLINCDNWFRYWSVSDDGANTHNRKNSAPIEYTYRGGSYTSRNFGTSSGAYFYGNPAFPWIALYNHASRSCAFNFQLPLPPAAAKIDFRTNGKGTDCIENTLEHEREHTRITERWNKQQANGGWQGLADSDKDRIPDIYEDGTRLYNGYDLSELGFDPNFGRSFPRSQNVGGFGFNFGNDEEVVCEIMGFGNTGTHKDDWANPGKQSNPAYKRIIVENGTNATLNGTYIDYGVDLNLDGLYDYLVIGVWVNVVDAGTYTVFGNIYNNGTMLWAENLTYLPSGKQMVLLNFDGLLIRKYRSIGYFNITDLTLFSETSADEDTSFNETLYMTSFYNYSQFEKPDAEFTGNLTDHGVDTNGNGLYEDLVMTVGVDISEAANYTIQGNIESGGVAVAVAQNHSYLSPGNHNLDLVFNGLEIRAHRKNAPYKLGLLRVRNSSYNELDVLYNYYNTSAYYYTQFERPKAEFTQNYTDLGLDTDDDGLYNYLTLKPEIDVETAGTYSISAYLLDSNYSGITWNSTTTYLPGGIQTISLPFDGMAISDHGINGSYKISALTLDDENGNMVSYSIYSLDTSFYNYTEFQRSSSITGIIMDSGGRPLSGIDVYLIGHDVSSTLTDINGSYRFMGLKQGNYTVEAHPSNLNLMVNSSYVYLSAGSALKVDFRLSPAGSIAGSVRDMNGNPIPDAFLYLSGFEMPRFRTDVNGSYSIPGLSEGIYEINVDASDLNFFENSSTVSVILKQTTVIDFALQRAPDDTPPESITDLKSIIHAQNYINWTWNDSKDMDFAYVEVWIDGVFKANVLKGVQYYNTTGLAPGFEHTIATRTVDTMGNINPQWVKDTSRIALLLIINMDPAPGSTFPINTPRIQLSLETDKPAECRFSENTREFSEMSIFDSTIFTLSSTYLVNPTNGKNYTIFINCRDQEGVENNTESFTFYIYNRTFLAPVLLQVPDITARENETLAIKINVTDPENDPLTITICDREVFGYTPIASRFTLENKTFKLNTNFNDAGRYYLRVAVSDGKDTVTSDFTLNVINVNRPPILAPIGNKIASEGSFFSYTVIASDPDGDELSFSDNTTLFNINPFSGMISFTPGISQSGDHHVNIIVTDGEYTDSEDVLFSISNVNNPPVIQAILPQKAIAGELFTLQINTSDPDNNNISFSDDTSLFDISAGGLINFTPVREDEGIYLINITATDGLLNSTRILNLVITGNNRPPIITSITDWITVYRNQSFDINVTACDPDTDVGCN